MQMPEPMCGSRESSSRVREVWSAVENGLSPKLRLLSSCLLFMASASLAAPLDRFRDCGTCPEMVVLPPGEFIIGSPLGEFGRKTDEGPQQRIRIDVPIAMGRTEVTYGQWTACVDDGGCNGYAPIRTISSWHKGTNHHFVLSDDHPVLYVSFEDAQAYITWLNQKLNTHAYRLPTEAEWEYAARAGTTTPYAQGEDLAFEQATYGSILVVPSRELPTVDSPKHLSPARVDELEAENTWGLRHMAGNAREWTLSCYSKHYENLGTGRAWLKNTTHACSSRVLRGGSYRMFLSMLRSASREKAKPDLRTAGFGFRVLKDQRTNEKE